MMQSVSQAYFCSVLEFMESQGIGREECLSAIGLQAEIGRNLRQRISLDYYSQLLDFGKTRLDDPLFGFHLGCQIQSADYGVLGYLVESGENLAGAIDSLLKYGRLVANIGDTRYTRTSQQVQLDWTPTQACSEQVVLRNMSAWISIVQQWLGNERHAIELRLTHAYSQPLLEQLSAHFGCPVIGASQLNSCIFPTSYLDLKFSSNNPELHASIDQLSQQQLAHLDKDQSCVAKVNTWLAGQFDLRHASLLRCANNLNLSARTLQRRLQSEQQHFGQLLDEHRRQRTLTLMGQLSWYELTLHLGFNEQSSFCRAFKRWFGCSPNQYLRSNMLAIYSN